MTTAPAPESTDGPEPTSDQQVVDMTARRTGPTLAGDVRSEALWARRRGDLVTERRTAHETFQRRIAAAQRELDRDLVRITGKEATLDGMRGQVAVLVRRPTGTPVTVYHSATGTCGRPFHYSNYKEQFESEVVNPRLHRCTACVWPA